MLFECEWCNGTCDAQVVASYEGKGLAGEDMKVSLLRCPGCDYPFLVYQTKSDNGVYGPAEMLFPTTGPNVSYSLPAQIRRPLEEAVVCFSSKAYEATTLMCRKTLEAICAEHHAEGKSLWESLKSLKEKGIIEARLHEWADMLRVTANDAAHSSDATVSAQDAKDVLDFTNALVEYVFTFRERFEQFKQRRAKDADG